MGKIADAGSQKCTALEVKILENGPMASQTDSGLKWDDGVKTLHSVGIEPTLFRNSALNCHLNRSVTSAYE